MKKRNFKIKEKNQPNLKEKIIKKYESKWNKRKRIWWLYRELIYKGEYINWERTGKGKEHNKYGKIEFLRRIFKRKKWNGKGKEYNKYDDLNILRRINKWKIKLKK